MWIFQSKSHPQNLSCQMIGIQGPQWTLIPALPCILMNVIKGLPIIMIKAIFLFLNPSLSTCHPHYTLSVFTPIFPVSKDLLNLACEKQGCRNIKIFDYLIVKMKLQGMYLKEEEELDLLKPEKKILTNCNFVF